ncbi:MAG: PilZ domain-containing protein [bacterium]
MSKERRQSSRHRLDLPLRFRIYLPSRPDPGPPTFHTGRLYDISRHGISLLTNTVEHNGLHIFRPDVLAFEQCLLEIELPREGEPLLIKGRVVWYDKAPPGSPFAFRAGVAFLDLSTDLRKQVKTFLHQAGSSSNDS